MAVPSALSLNYDAVLSTTLFNVKGELVDQISTSNVFLYYIMKKNSLYKGNSAIGDRMQVPLMYALAPADSYSGYDVLDTTPTDGITSAFFDWAQFATHVSISGLEEKKNKGEAAIVKLLTAKTKQAVMGIEEKFAKALLQGNLLNSGNVYDAYVSPANGSTFIEPLGSLVRYDPSTSDTIGNINQATYSWWRNQTKTSAATTNAGLLAEMRNMYNNVGKGAGGSADLILCDQTTFELYEAALSTFHQNASWKKADIPFDNVEFRGKPVVWDEFIPNVYANTTDTSTATGGTMYFLNSKFFGIEYESATNFEPQGFVKPDNQDAKVNQILWLGASSVSQRRKQGVIGKIARSLA